MKVHVIVTGNIPQLHISYKPQKISPKSQGTVRQLLHEKIREAYVYPQVGTFLISGGDVYLNPNVTL
jgi:translation initiation factor RLI1